MAANEENTDITRVLLWCLPRTVSTSFLKCMTYVPNCQAWYEPYLMSLYFSNSYKHREALVAQCRDLVGWKEDTTTFGSCINGHLREAKDPYVCVFRMPVSVSTIGALLPCLQVLHSFAVQDPLATKLGSKNHWSKTLIYGYWAVDKPHSWVKDKLESAPPEDKKVVFVKDMSLGVDGFYEYIPNGFRHSFLIRHPYKIFDSWYRAINRGISDKSRWIKLTEMPEHMMPKGGLLKEHYDMYQHVKEHYKENPVIIDSDDLLADPGRVLKAHCEAVGIPYTDDLLEWKPGRECMDRE